MHTAIAPGAPGLAAHWTTSHKEGVGTALSGSCNVWFTLSQGIVNEVYYPRMDLANVRDMQLIVTNGTDFFSEERRHTYHHCQTEESGIPAYHLTNTCHTGRYRLEKRLITDPNRAALLQEITFTPLQGQLKDYRLYLLLTPQLQNEGMHITGWTGEDKGCPMLFAEGGGVALACACSRAFIRMSCGFVGVSDPWRDLMAHRQLTTCYRRAEYGSIALAAEIDLIPCQGRCVVALAFGAKGVEAGLQAKLALAQGFEKAWQVYTGGWRDFCGKSLDLSAVDAEGGRLFHMSRAVLKIHENKHFTGSSIASLARPPGLPKNEPAGGDYQRLWPRNQVQAALANLAAGYPESARQTLLFLMSTQERDGHWAQCLGEDGSPHGHHLQLDETALPILLADQLRRHQALAALNPLPMIQRAVSFLIQKGPVTQEDRWCEEGGYTPFTLATQIAALLAAADFIAEAGDLAAGEYLREIADWWNANIERWLYVSGTMLAERCGVPGYYVRATPVSAAEDVPPSSSTASLRHLPLPARSTSHVDSISADALSLVRYGLRSPQAPEMRCTLQVIDATLKYETAQGPVWRRHNRDDAGAPCHGTAQGRAWLLLSGERAHYALMQGEVASALELSRSMVRFGGNEQLLPECIEPDADISTSDLYHEHVNNSVRPLVGVHAEYILLLRSLRDGAVFDMPPQTQQRYLVNRVPALYGLWRFNHQLQELPAGKRLRIQAGAQGFVRWTKDSWQSYADIPLQPVEQLGIFYADLPTEELIPNTLLQFTFFWHAAQHWENSNFQTTVGTALPRF